MADTRVATLFDFVVNDMNILLSLELGYVRVTSSSTCSYKTLLGLAPNHSDSLLSVEYCQGGKALMSYSQDEVCEAL